MDSVLVFRRMSRQEYISLPPAADESFFARLAHLKSVNDNVDRSADRAPLWSARRSVSVRAAIGVAVGVFLFGLMLPMPERTARNAPHYTDVGRNGRFWQFRLYDYPVPYLHLI